MIRCAAVFFFKQKTAYEMRISDWSSDVCSSDLGKWLRSGLFAGERGPPRVSGLGTAGRQAPLAWASVQVSGNRRKVGPDAGASAGETSLQPVGGDDIGRQALQIGRAHV